MFVLMYINFTLTLHRQLNFVQTLNKNARNLQGNVRTFTLHMSHPHVYVGLHSTGNMDGFKA
jgi:hypothetical protein